MDNFEERLTRLESRHTELENKIDTLERGSEQRHEEVMSELKRHRTSIVSVEEKQRRTDSSARRIASKGLAILRRDSPIYLILMILASFLANKLGVKIP